MLPRGSYAGLKVEHTKTVFFHHVPTACGRCAGRGHACVISTASALHIAVATSNIIVFPSRRHHRRPPSPRRRTGTYTRCKCTLFSPSKTPPLSCPSLLFRHSRQGRAPLPAYSRGATRPRNDGTQLSRARCMSVLIAPIAIRVRPRLGGFGAVQRYAARA